MYPKSIILTQQLETIKNFICGYCHQTRYKSGFFVILKEGGIQLFCSKECSDYDKKRNRVLICDHCGTSFENKSSGYKRKFCSNICSVNAHYNNYKKFNWCDMCNEWIRKENSIFKPAGTTIHHLKTKYKIKRDNYYCPICHSKLRIRKWAKKKSKK